MIPSQDKLMPDKVPDQVQNVGRLRKSLTFKTLLKKSYFCASTKKSRQTTQNQIIDQIFSKL